MAVWSIVSTSQLEYLRIDADYYHPQYLDEIKYWVRLSDRATTVKLQQLIRMPVRTGRTPSLRRILDGDKCIRFIKTDTIRDGAIDFNRSATLPLRVLAHRDIIPKDSLVITIIGATPEIVGRTAIVKENDPTCVTNQNVAVVCTNNRCDPYYLTAYFQTKWGRDQLWRHSRRTEQVNLNCREVERVLVPLPTTDIQNSIGCLVRDSFAAIDGSVAIYQQAQDRLDRELGMDKLTFEKPVGYTAQFSELEQSHRLDAQHYQPRFSKLLKHLSIYPTDFVRNIRAYNRRGVQPIYVKNGDIAVVNSQHLGPKHVDYEGLARTTDTLFRASPVAHIQENDLLIYGTGAYVGRTNIYLQNTPALASNHVSILRFPPEIDAAYMSMVFQSTVGQLQTHKHIRGSTQAELYPADIDHFVVPLLKPQIQKQIGSLVRESLEKERESKRLLEQAKARVEKLIEEAVK